MSFDPVNFGELARRPAQLYPDKVAIEQDELVLTYRELERRTQQVAGLLTRLDVRPGDRVLLLLANDYRFAECLLGTLRAGAIAVPVNIKLGADQLMRFSDALAHLAHEGLFRIVLIHHPPAVQGPNRFKRLIDFKPA